MSVSVSRFELRGVAIVALCIFSLLYLVDIIIFQIKTKSAYDHYSLDDSYLIKFRESIQKEFPGSHPFDRYDTKKNRDFIQERQKYHDKMTLKDAPDENHKDKVVVAVQDVDLHEQKAKVVTPRPTSKPPFGKGRSNIPKKPLSDAELTKLIKSDGCDHYSIPYDCELDPIKDADYIPIFYYHGVNDNSCQGKRLLELLKEEKKKVSYACSIPLFEDGNSITHSIMTQAEEVAKFIRDHHEGMDEYQLVCHSQGALVCRAVLQQMDDHRVSHAILTAGPLEGVYGNIMDIPIAGDLLHHASNFILNGFLQDHLSVANLIHDPVDTEHYKKDNHCIPILDGYKKEGEKNEDFERRLIQYKENFQKLKNLWLLVSPKDDLIKPYQSAHFGYYQPGHKDKGSIVPFSMLRVDHTLGLSQMGNEKRLHRITAPNVKHTDWTYNSETIKTQIIPRLGQYSKKEDSDKKDLTKKDAKEKVSDKKDLTKKDAKEKVSDKKKEKVSDKKDLTTKDTEDEKIIP